VLHVSTILYGHHQALQNTIQVIKLLVIIRIRIVATDGCVAKEYKKGKIIPVTGREGP
jgi:hypothetical protein